MEAVKFLSLSPQVCKSARLQLGTSHLRSEKQPNFYPLLWGTVSQLGNENERGGGRRGGKRLQFQALPGLRDQRLWGCELYSMMQTLAG